MSPIIIAKGIAKTFERKRILKGVDLKVRRGETFSLFGANGTGKTTLLRILSTISRPTKGEFSINGFHVLDDPIGIRRSIGFISHSSYLYDDMTAIENLTFFGRIYGVDERTLPDRVTELLRKVELSHRKHDRVEVFSRGMKQRLSIARALIHEPQVLLLDEPFTGLDQHATTILVDMLREFKAHGGTTVIVTHDLERGLAMSDRVGILSGGRLDFTKDSASLSLSELRSKYTELSG